jgi:phosphatidylserine decarboxylase
MPAEPLRYFNRRTGQLETEQIYGEGWLHWTYENPVGRFFLWALVKRALFSRLYGWQMSKRVSANQVLPFVIKYNLDIAEFAKSVYDFRSFNEFFSRALKKSARLIAPGDDVAVFPADGRHLVFPNVDIVEGFYVKGAKFSLVALFADESEARRFAGGAMVISRLCPVDYHRFHFPCAGMPTGVKKIQGPLYSVSPLALRQRIEYLVQNKRVITWIESSVFGRAAMIEVGATNVGSIVHTFVVGMAVEKGEEKGLFKFGGSCVITLFERGRINFDPDLIAQSRQYIETYARMGERMGVASAQS